MEYKVKYGQTIYDIAILTYGKVEYIYKLIKDNPFIDSLDYDFDANPGAVIYWDESLAIPKSNELNANADVTEKTLSTIIPVNGQSIFDICLMTYGDLKYLYTLLQDNNIVSLNDTNLIGKTIKFNPDLVQDIGVYNYLVQKPIATIENTNKNTGKAYNKSYNISFH